MCRHFGSAAGGRSSCRCRSDGLGRRGAVRKNDPTESARILFALPTSTGAASAPRPTSASARLPHAVRQTKKRGVGERWHDPLSTADPLTTRRGTRPVLRAIPIQSVLGTREAQTSISPTPSVADSGVISRSIARQSCALTSPAEHEVADSSERRAPSRRSTTSSSSPRSCASQEPSSSRRSSPLPSSPCCPPSQV